MVGNDTTTRVTALVCPNCGDIIFSRSRHDFRWCSCGEIAVDGGSDYLKMTFDKIAPEIVEVEVPASKQQLFDDWNYKVDKFGVISHED